MHVQGRGLVLILIMLRRLLYLWIAFVATVLFYMLFSIALMTVMHLNFVISFSLIYCIVIDIVFSVQDNKLICSMISNFLTVDVCCIIDFLSRMLFLK